MHVHVTMSVSVCIIISRQVYCMSHYAMYRSMCATMQAGAQMGASKSVCNHCNRIRVGEGGMSLEF